MKNLISKLLGISRYVLDFLLPILRSGFAQILERLLPIALLIVRELATSNLGGAEKRAKAMERLKVEATSAGVQVAESTLNLIIEMAVARLKEAK